MNDWLNSTLNSDAITFTMIVALFILGVISTFTSCCNYALIGSITGYSAGHAVNSNKKSQIYFSLAFFIGSVISLAIIGALIGYVGSTIATIVGAFWKIIVSILLIVFGLFSLGLIPFNLPKLNYKSKGKGFIPGLILGLVTGGLSILLNLCCNPILPIVLGATFLKAGVLSGIIILTSFAFGYSLPFAVAIAGIQFGVSKISNNMQNVGKVIGYIAGIIMIISGFYLIYTY